jgi:hypothetical protein
VPIESFVPRSSNLSTCAYNPETQELAVTFQSGEQYTYSSVPESVWHGLKHAASAGSYFYRNIRSIFNYTQA